MPPSGYSKHREPSDAGGRPAESSEGRDTVARMAGLLEPTTPKKSSGTTGSYSTTTLRRGTTAQISCRSKRRDASNGVRRMACIAVDTTERKTELTTKIGEKACRFTWFFWCSVILEIPWVANVRCASLRSCSRFTVRSKVPGRKFDGTPSAPMGKPSRTFLVARCRLRRLCRRRRPLSPLARAAPASRPSIWPNCARRWTSTPPPRSPRTETKTCAGTIVLQNDVRLVKAHQNKTTGRAHQEGMPRKSREAVESQGDAARCRWTRHS